MEEIVSVLTDIQNGFPWKRLFIGLFVVLLGQALLKTLDWIYDQATQNLEDARAAASVRKFFVYCFNLILFIIVLRLLKVDMKLVIGATGLMTLAIGFAARTPISNLISGIFLVFERPFVVGNIIEVNEFKGEVVSRNLLSLTLRTLDNRMVRIPNEIVIGSSVSNVSYFPIRRLDVKYLLANKDSLTRLEEILNDVASRNGLALDEPEPYFYVNEFRETHVEVIFRVWSSSDDFLKFQSEFPKEIHRAVKASGMEAISQRIELSQPLKIESSADK